jgi:hypothetical protein
VWKRSGPDPADLPALSDRRLRQAYRDVDLDDGTTPDAARRAALADRIAEELLRRHPGDAAMWFDRALLAKWRRDWATATDHGVRALDLVPADHRDGEPAAWNLGIAATARRDWATARQAWRAFGIDVHGSGAEPIVGDLGLAPVRLNPPLRHVGQSPVLVDGVAGGTEVVWGRRLDPARVQLVSVPLPASGHRCGDVVLHDGVPQGTRRLGGEEVGVFDEIELWERSPRPTLGVVVTAPSAREVDQLVDDLDAAGLAGEDWTSTVRSLCAACSEGTPGEHTHPGGAGGADGWTVGISALPDDADQVLTDWLGKGPGRGRGELTVELA